MADLGELELVLYHGTNHNNFPLDPSNLKPFTHVGTERAALERILNTSSLRFQDYHRGRWIENEAEKFNPKLYRMLVKGKPGMELTDSAASKFWANDWKELNKIPGHHFNLYENLAEDRGSLSAILTRPDAAKAIEEVPIKFGKYAKEYPMTHDSGRVFQRLLHVAEKYPQIKRFFSVAAGIPDFTPLETFLDAHQKTFNRQPWESPKPEY